MIKVLQANKFFNRRKTNQIHVINDVCMEFPESGLIVLLGASGSGKTTILNVIGGLDKIDSGTIEFNDQLIKRYSSKIWDKLRNEEIGYVFQNYHLLPQLSVFDNIAFVLKMLGINDPETIERFVNYVLEAVKMFPYRHKKALQLSGGQMQRVAIARALVKNPKVIIADEPTGNLDSKNASEIMNIIKAISKEKLVILVTHDRNLAEIYGDRVIEIKDGSVVNTAVNEQSDIVQYGEDNSIYLQDLQNISLKEGAERINLYYDADSKKELLDVKLIIKNNVLYLKVDTNYPNMQIIDDNSTIKVKDENYRPKTRQEFTHTDYDIKTLNIDEVKTKKRRLFSLKNAILMTINHLSKSRIRMHFMLISFVLSGILLAVSTALIFAQINPDIQSVVDRPENYVVINSKSILSYQQINEYLAEKGTVNSYDSVQLRYILPDSIDGNAMTSIVNEIVNKQMDIVENLDKNAITRGRMPQNINEIAISEHLLMDLLNNKNLIQSAMASGPNNYGYWKITDFLNEEVEIFVTSAFGLYPARRVRIVGMTNSKNTGIFVMKMFTYQLYSGMTMQNPDEFEESLFTQYNNSNYQGVEAGINYFIHTDNQADLINHLRQYETLEVWKAIDYFKDMIKLSVVEYVITMVAFFLGLFSALGFYFIIRSSMISRIYEISIYRALGVRKWDIIKSFIVEIVSITIISSLIGYIIAMVGFNAFNQEIINIYPIFTVDFSSVTVGILLMFVVNILFGLWPLLALLNKTPAAIISKYDI